jgi:hypothetical protein
MWSLSGGKRPSNEVEPRRNRREADSQAGSLSLIIRLGRARGIEHEQLKWFVASLALSGVLLVATASFILVEPRVGNGIWIFALLGFATIPPAVGIAVLRYRLYEIDRIVRTFVLARPTGFEPATFGSGGRRSIH